MSLFRRKPIRDLQAEAETDQRLRRTLGPFNLTALGVGAVIGAGHLRADRAGGGQLRRAGDRVLVHPGRHRLRLRRASATPSSPR